MDGARQARMRRWVRDGARAALCALLLSTSMARGDGPDGGAASRFESIPLTPRTAADGRAGATGAPASGAMEVSRVIGALGAVIGLIFAVRWAGRRFLGMSAVSGVGGGGGVRILSRIALAPRQQLMLIQVGQRVVLVANTGVQMNALCEITDAQEVAALLGDAHSRPQRIVGAGSFLAAFGHAGRSYAADEPMRAAPDGDHPRRGDDGDSVVPPTHAELAGLLEKVRLMSGTFRKT